MRRVAILAVVALGLSGCGFDGAQSLPLPGAAGGGGYEVTITFTDATNLVPKETCRANDTVIGSVVSVELDERLDAEVVCRIEADVELPGNVEATLRETSLLGERFVSLEVPPEEEPVGRLDAGASVPVSSTLVHPNTEVVLGALSQVLNGGSLGNIATISRELSAALDDRTDDARLGARRLADLVQNLDDNRANLVSTLTALGDLTATLDDQRDVIAATLDDVPAGLAVLDRQRPALTRALARVNRLSRSIVPLLRRSRANTVADLRHLTPLLSGLTDAGDDLALTLERVASFPFNGNTLYTIKGDYAGAYIQANLNLDTFIALLADLVDQTPGMEPETPGLPDLVAPELPFVPQLPLPGLGDLLGGLLGGRLGKGPISDAFADLNTSLGQAVTGRRAGVADRTPPTSLAELIAGGAW